MIDWSNAGWKLTVSGTLGGVASDSPIVKSMGPDVQEIGLWISAIVGGTGLIIQFVFKMLSLAEEKKHNRLERERQRRADEEQKRFNDETLRNQSEALRRELSSQSDKASSTKSKP